MRKKAILHVLVRLDYGGIETWLINVLRNYNRDKFQMDICLIGRQGKIGILGDQAINVGSTIFVIPLRNPFQFILKFQQLATNYELVLVHTGIHISPLVLFAAFLAGVQHRLLMLHSSGGAVPVRGLDRKQDGLFFNLITKLCKKLNRAIATNILGCSKAALDQLYPNWRANQFAQVLYPGIDLDRFSAPVNRDQLRETLGIPKNALILGHVGRFSREKNHQNFIRVAKYLNGINPNIHFLLVGDGSLRSEIELQIRNADLENRFHLLGVRNDVPQLMSIMDLAYFPSLYEGFPLTFVEAQVSGLLLVTGTRLEMGEAVCPENHPWYLVDTNNIERSGDAILCLLSDPELRSQLTARAQEWAINRFSIKQSTLSLESILI